MHLYSQHTRLLVFLLALSMLTFGLTFGCGRKLPPVPSEAVVPAVIQDLAALNMGDRLKLSWSIPKKDGNPMKGIKGFRLYKHETLAPDTLCPTCPIPFMEHIFINLRVPSPARVEGGRVIYDERVNPEHGYAYKVVSHHSSGGISGDSNVVLIVP